MGGPGSGAAYVLEILYTICSFGRPPGHAENRCKRARHKLCRALWAYSCALVGYETVNSVSIWASELESWMWGVQQFIFLGGIVSGCSAVPSPRRCSSEAQLGFSSQLWQPEMTKNTECWDSSEELWILSSLSSQLFLLLAWEKNWVWGGERVNFIPFMFLKVAFTLMLYRKEIRVLIDAPSINIQWVWNTNSFRDLFHVSKDGQNPWINVLCWYVV